MCHMKMISLRELHEATGEWVRRAARLGVVTVTDRGKPIARIVPVVEEPGQNRFRERKLRPGYAKLLGTLQGGTDSTAMVSADRDER